MTLYDYTTHPNTQHTNIRIHTYADERMNSLALMFAMVMCAYLSTHVVYRTDAFNRVRADDGDWG